MTPETAPRKFLGVWLPAHLWLDRNLSITEKAVLAEIASLETPERGCYASNGYFAEFFDLSPSRVSEIINNLSRRGYVVITRITEGERHIERQIRVSDPFGKPKPPLRKTEAPPSENRR